MAANNGHTDVVALLLSHGANPNTVEEVGFVILCIVIKF